MAGLSPSQVLDCELWQYNAVVMGYRDRMRENLVVGVFTGFYSGYYHPLNKSKKTPTEIARSLSDPAKRKARKEEVDVAAFEATERAFNEMSQGG